MKRHALDPLVRAAAAELRTIGAGSGEGLLERTVDVLHRVAEAETTFFYRVVETSVGPRVASFSIRAGERATRALERGVRAIGSFGVRDPGERYVSWNPDRVRRFETEAFCESAITLDRAWFERSKLYQQVFVPGGMHDQQRLLVRDGSHLVGWMGFMRNDTSPLFAAKDRRRLAPLVAPVTASIVAAARLHRAEAPDVPGDFVVRADGRVEFASTAAGAWLARPGFREALIAHVRDVDRGGDFEPTHDALTDAEARTLRMDGHDGVRYLVHVRAARPMVLPLSFALSDAESEVAELAASGATASEIAAARRTSPGTARNQLKRVYKALGVSNRVELVRALARK